ncbi:transposase [Cytobacillus purgationiresistens]|uniref:Transposase n=1 Tax=Cytobacillus purgationiresistens TaxID=863449 RepID=A0ABU0AJG6_9BACI|nr:transposase [Cytobacillus purgationiresistens]
MIYFSTENIKNIGLRISAFISGLLANISSEGIGSSAALIQKPTFNKSFT